MGRVEYSRVKEYIHIDFAVERTRLLLPPLYHPDFSARFESIEGQCRCQADTLTFFPDSFSPDILSPRTQLAIPCLF